MVLATEGQGPGGPLVINGVEMDLNVINEVVNLNDTEIWELDNRTGGPHPFHIHDVQFQILDRDGQPPSPSEAGWKDTIMTYPREVVRFITKFEDFADPSVPYMYHCHFLGHEDGGMMGQFIVIDPNATSIDRNVVPTEMTLSAYPNPTVDWTTITYSLQQRGPVAIDVYDTLGRHVFRVFEGSRAAGENESIIRSGNLPAGTYFVHVQTEQGLQTKSITVLK